MSQITSKIYFDGAYYDPQDKLWVRGSRAQDITIKDWDINTMPVFDMIRQFLSDIDPSVTINTANWFNSLNTLNSNLSRLTIYKGLFPAPTLQKDAEGTQAPDYKCEDAQLPMLTVKFSDLLKQLNVMFGVDWIIDNGEFKLIHTTEDCRTVPTIATEPENYLNDYNALDFSNGDFLDEESRKIRAETWTVGSKEDDGNFAPQRLEYETPYTEEVGESANTFETDVATVWRNLETKMVIIGERADGVMEYGTDAVTGEMLYNRQLSTYNLVTKFHKDGRPYDKGKLKQPNAAAMNDLILTHKRDSKTTITAPFYHSKYVDFTKLIVTNFGNLQPLQMTVNIDAGTIEIEAAK
jgi:hypothetical protein